MPLQLGTHTVFGTLLLKLLAAQRWLRRRGQRYADEQALIERWLDGVVRHSATDWRLGHEIALCGRLIKGYGGTHQRGRDNLLHILDQLAERTPFATHAQRAQAIAQARGAALADEGGWRSTPRCSATARAPRPRARGADPLRAARETVADGLSGLSGLSASLQRRDDQCADLMARNACSNDGPISRWKVSRRAAPADGSDGAASVNTVTHADTLVLPANPPRSASMAARASDPVDCSIDPEVMPREQAAAVRAGDGGRAHRRGGVVPPYDLPLPAARCRPSGWWTRTPWHGVSGCRSSRRTR